MAIEIQIVGEDFITILSYQKSIIIDDDFYLLRKKARELEYNFIGTLDDAGDTVYNFWQRKILSEEIEKMRQLKGINYMILDTLQAAIHACGNEYHVYIRCLGD